MYYKMSDKVKDIDIKNDTYYFFDDIININIFHPNNIKIDERSYKNVLIYYIGCVTIKDLKYVKINSVNLLYLIFIKVNGYIEEINKIKYLKLVPTNVICKIKIFFIFLVFLSITTALLMPVSICCYMIKYKANQKHYITVLHHK